MTLQGAIEELNEMREDTSLPVYYALSLADVINTLQTDVQEVKHGRWEKGRVSSTGGGSYGVYQCSICEAMFPDVGYGYNYCPNCGASMMDEVERNEN